MRNTFLKLTFSFICFAATIADSSPRESFGIQYFANSSSDKILNSPILKTLTYKLYDNPETRDSLKDYQLLYNGRVWMNLYYMVEGDQFLFSNDFLVGTVSINGKTFTNIRLRYDIYKDEIIIPSNPGGILQLNKELVDSFSIFYQGKNYRFVKIQQPENQGLNGYVNVLYNDKSEFYIKQMKQIKIYTTGNERDNFNQVNQMYLVINKIVFPVSNKNELLKVFGEKKKAVKEYIKKNHLLVSRQNPESFIPVIRYFDSINQYL